jgi:hypothetical protein
MATLETARAYARRKYRELRNGDICATTPMGRQLYGGPWLDRCHRSFAVAEALRLTEEQYPDMFPGFGVEGDTDHEYINQGETYATTVLVTYDACHGRPTFRVSSWGDWAERQR